MKKIVMSLLAVMHLAAFGMDGQSGIYIGKQRQPVTYVNINKVGNVITATRLPDEARIRIRYYPQQSFYRGEEVERLQKDGEEMARTPGYKLYNQDEAAKLYKELNFK